MNVSILGTEYKITVKKYQEYEAFEREHCNGFCDEMKHEIILCDMATYPNFEHESADFLDLVQKQVLRHEIVHAFLAESGLSECAAIYSGAWAKFEEMVDWIANQGPKIYAAWAAAGAI